MSSTRTMTGRVAPQKKIEKVEKADEIVTHDMPTTNLDIIEVTPALTQTWGLPLAQRGKTINAKVKEAVVEIASTGVIPGIITLGKMKNKLYKIDGQHRVVAFEMSGLETAYAEVRILPCKDEAEMAYHYHKLHDSYVTNKPDDGLRAMELFTPSLAIIRRDCPWVGYADIRRNPDAPIVGMSVALRSWLAAQQDVPTIRDSARVIAEQLTEADAEGLSAFLLLAQDAWGRDPEYSRLWGALNLTLIMWLYHRIVGSMTSTLSRTVRLNASQFGSMITALSANPVYLDWLRGRSLRESDRSPCYGRIRAILIRRLTENGIKQPIRFPSPAWAPGGNRSLPEHYGLRSSA